MIYTVTLNPALDYVVNFDEFHEGLVNRSKYDYIQSGGKGINVSTLLKELNHDSVCLGFVGGFTGDELVRQVNEDLGLKSDFVKIKNGKTRINVKIHSEIETEIGGTGPQISDEELETLLKQLDQLNDGDVLVLSGSAPASLKKDVYCDLLERVKDTDVLVVVDATGDLLKKTLAYKPFLIKPNHHELGELFDKELKDLDEIAYYAKELQKLGARNVLISMAKDGSLLVDEKGEVHVVGVCKGKVVNSVGAGDSMLAGFVAGYLDGKDPEDIQKLATACGGATAFSEGIAKRELIDELLKQLY